MQWRHILAGGVVFVAILDAATTQYALIFCRAFEANPLQAILVTDPIVGIGVRLLSAAAVILTTEMLMPWFRKAYWAVRGNTGSEPPVNLVCYSACILGSLPCIAGNLGIILA